MKTKEELNELKQNCIELSKKLKELNLCNFNSKHNVSTESLKVLSSSIKQIGSYFESFSISK